MKTSTSIIHTLFAGALFLGASSQVSAARIFPPAHLTPNANFATGTVSDQAVEDAWYQSEIAEHRGSLQASELQEKSPYPPMYYFVNIRGHANDERARLDTFQNQSETNVEITDNTEVDDDNS